MNEEHMRSIVAFGDGADDLIEKFNALPNWNLKTGDVPGSYSHLLQQGDTKIYLDVKAGNVIKTANVYPQDQSSCHPDYHNDVLQSLSDDLHSCGIEHVLNLSASDEAKLKL